MQPEQFLTTGDANRFAAVSNACRDRLACFAALLASWQRAHNLVAASTMADLWTRHIADSLQLLDHVGRFRRWVDLGSGAGFPGLVVAIALADRPGIGFTLVEANQKKAAFLRAAIRETGSNAEVAAMRIEDHSQTMIGRADVVSARALARLDRLCLLSAPYLHQDSVLLLPKGQDVVQEHEQASQSWSYDLVSSPSKTDPTGRIVQIRNLRPRLST